VEVRRADGSIGVKMTTKAKCLKLAAEHGLTLDYSLGYTKSSSVDLPDGYVDFDGRTGLCFEVYEMSAAQFWKEVYQDIESVVMAKARWQKVSELVGA